VIPQEKEKAMSFDNYQHWNTATSLGVMRELDPMVTYWLDLAYAGRVVTFDEEYIDFEQIPAQGRKLAPFVMPMVQGKPVYDRRSRVQRMKPAYIKELDAVTPTRAMTKGPGSLFSDASKMSPLARYNAIKVDITQTHMTAIYRRWEWMAARSIIDGKVVIEGEGYPSQEVDFGRNPNHDIVLGAGNRWGEAGVSIIDSLQDWLDTMHIAEFGGAGNRITVGLTAWRAMRKDPEIKELLNTDYRGDSSDLKRGLIGTGEVRFVGTLDGGPDVYVYNDYYHVDGVATNMMDPRDIVLTGPAIEGFQCFGAIQDAHSGFQAMPIFPRNWLPDSDPAVEQILHQSAPLFVPVNPNASLRARVVA
jgi:hypothetical protein